VHIEGLQQWSVETARLLEADVIVINDIYSLLRFDEGERLYVYDDFNGKPIVPGSHVFGNPTIGVGRTLAINGISQDESDQMLTHDVQKWYAAFKDPWFLALDNVRRAAIVDMAHAMGVAGVRGFHDMIAALSRQDWGAAYAAVLASTWSTEANARAKRVANMLKDGAWPTV
jgi:hypothetical protein